ncbi:hypothetical protein EUX98_g4535 [Antrodiella citrinella]|uniref:C2 domain-containing protein n=1 Tax=Antrodiella citrinella TaxID=2447956 RepID=A0A4V6S1V0_9APHY|nr:hypothetical protein EUX98_g4535 [Antrodiella citrinella]
MSVLVLSASELSPRKSCIPTLPNCYVRVIAGEFRRETPVVERSVEPSWDQKLVVPVTGNEMPLDIQLWHKSLIPLRSYKIGQFKTTFSQLLRQQLSNETESIRITLVEKKTNGNTGYLRIKVSEVDDGVVVEQAMDEAHHVEEDAKKDTLPGVPSNDTVEMLKAVAEKINGFTGILDKVSQLYPPASVACSIVFSVIQAINAQTSRDAKVIGLVAIMDKANSFLGEYKKMSDITAKLAEFIKATLNQTVECSLFIQEFYQVGFMTRLATQAFDKSADKKIEEFTSAFTELQTQRMEGTVVQATLVSYRVLSVATDIRRDQILGRLRTVTMDAAGREACLPNTRNKLLEDLITWVLRPSEQNIRLVVGMWGSGKSALATTLANYFSELHRLGAYLFFSRTPPQTTGPVDVIRSLAAHLAVLDTRIAEAVAEHITAYPNATEGALLTQFNELLVKPLQSLDVDVHTKKGPAISAEGPILVLIDGLDQCGDPKSRKELISVLAAEASKLPKWLRIVITSRPEADLNAAFAPCQNIYKTPLDIESPENKADIATYVRGRLEAIRLKNTSLGLTADWPGQDALVKISRKAAGLFAWANTACTFIDSHYPPDRLKAVVEDTATTGPEDALAELYGAALQTVGKWEDSDFAESFRVVMGTIVVTAEPLSAETIDKLVAGSKKIPSMHTIEYLGCVLTWGPNTPIHILHPTFHDYLCSPRCKDSPWFIDSVRHRRTLGISCLRHVSRHLTRFHTDIIRLDLGSRDVFTEAQKRFPADIQHAYKFWIEYLCSVPYDTLKAIAKDVASVLMPVAFNDWCTMVDVLWTRFKVLELSYTLLAWITDNLAQLSALDSRITADAIQNAIEQVYELIGLPPPGTPRPAPSRPLSSHGSVVSSAPPKINFTSVDVALAEKATSAPAGDMMPWHLTHPYKMLKDLRKKLSGQTSPRSAFSKERLRGIAEAPV